MTVDAEEAELRLLRRLEGRVDDVPVADVTEDSGGGCGGGEIVQVVHEVSGGRSKKTGFALARAPVGVVAVASVRLVNVKKSNSIASVRLVGPCGSLASRVTDVGLCGSLKKVIFIHLAGKRLAIFVRTDMI